MAISLPFLGVASTNPWRSHRLKQAGRRAAPWVIYPAALIGFLNACSSACTSPPPAVDVNQVLRMGAYGSSALIAYLESSAADPSPAAKFYDASQIAFPPAPAALVCALPEEVDPQGDGTFDVHVHAIMADGTAQSWRVPILVTGSGDQQRYSTAGGPSTIRGPIAAKPATLKSPHQIPADNPAAATATAFLTAWLTGQNDWQRYARPNAISSWPTAPFTSVTPVAVMASGGAPAKVAGHIDVTAIVLAEDRYNIQQSYTLTLVADNGQWLVEHIKPIPAVDPPK